MNLYFAPLEGITTYTYRNTHAAMFGCCDAYFSPFISPGCDEKVSLKMLRDILPENNTAIPLKVQVLCNHPEAFRRFALKITELGYDEVNINLGCPSGTVVGKGRGAGFLREPGSLEEFLDEVFSHNDIKISIKTRAGFYSGDEMPGLMRIYNKYPMTQLIIHPRVREDYYKSFPRFDVFTEAYQASKNPVCYNGNVFDTDDYNRITCDYPQLEGVMLGRGAVANPALFREIKGGARLTTAELLEFTQKLKDNYYELLRSDTYTLHKLKEIWLYMMWNYPEEKKILKAIKKSDKCSELMNAINKLPEI